MTRALGLPDSFAGIREKGRREPSYLVDPIGKLPPLKPFQRGLLRAMRESFNGSSRAMVSSFTGTGKTRIGMEYAVESLQSDEPDEVVLWVAQKSELLEQACDSIEQLWPWLTRTGESLQVFRYWEGERFESLLPQGPSLVIGTAQQIISRLAQQEPFLMSALARTHLLIIDEAHHALARGHQTIIEGYEAARSGRPVRVLGLTATPGRSNIVDPCETAKLAALFGHRLIVPEVAAEDGALHWFQAQKYLSLLTHRKVEAPSQVQQTLGKRQLPVAEDQAGYRDFTSEFLEVVGEDSMRNRTILQTLAQLSAAGRHMLVFCCNIPQAEMLFQSVLVQGDSAGLIHHKIDPRDRQHTIARFRRRELRMLFNVEVLTTGFDAPKVDTIVMCRPTLSRVLYEQMVGRGMRGPEMGGTEHCEVVDFTTNFGRFNEPQAWEAFWEEWKRPDQDPTSERAWPGWEIVRAEPEVIPPGAVAG